MSRWFRHYAGMMRDEKLVRAALRAKQPIERVVWIWGAILESAAEINDGGRHDFDCAEAAYFLRSEEADISAVVDALAASGRLAEGCVVNWGARQFESDRSASRQAAYRERKRSQGSDGDDNQTSGDGEVTAASRHGDAPETETETETETENRIESSLRSLPREQPVKKSRRKATIALPDSWRPSPGTLEYARKQGLSEREFIRETERFRNHASQNDRHCADWDAALRNWCLKAAEDRGREPVQDVGQSATKLVFVKAETPQWDAWQHHLMTTSGRGSPCVNFGWHFPSEWPPGYVRKAESRPHREAAGEGV